MESRKDQLQVLEHFNKALKADKARPQIAQLSELGLVELTRKRQGKNIYELFGSTCPTCGLGHLVHLPWGTRARSGCRNTRTVSHHGRNGALWTLPPGNPACQPLGQNHAKHNGLGEATILTMAVTCKPSISNHPSYQEPDGPTKSSKRHISPSD